MWVATSKKEALGQTKQTPAELSLKGSALSKVLLTEMLVANWPFTAKKTNVNLSKGKATDLRPDVHAT